MKYPVVFNQSITAFVIGIVCLILGVNTGFSGSDGTLFLVVCVVLIAAGILTFVYWLRKRNQSK